MTLYNDITNQVEFDDNDGVCEGIRGILEK